jgi:hypothetical protein
METLAIILMILGGLALIASFGFLFVICALYAWINYTEKKE